jgi:hypothetical protein
MPPLPNLAYYHTSFHHTQSREVLHPCKGVTGAGAIIRKSILPFKILEHQNIFLFGELCFVWAFNLNQVGEITLVKVRDRTTFLLKTFSPAPVM